MLKKSFLIVTLIFAIVNSYAQNIKVFILAGQSNMEGFGQVEDESLNGTLEHFLTHEGEEEFGYFTDVDDDFVTREDVWVRFDRAEEGLKAGDLGVGYGAYDEFIGPEYGFGFQMADYCDEQVLIVKTAWGGKNLAVDFRPPSSGGETGPYYTQILTDVNAAIDNIAFEFPDYDGQVIEIAGFVWFQGWNDGEEDEYLLEYEENLINLIKDIRVDLEVPNLKFVVANTGIGGFELMEDDLWVYNLQTQLIPAQGNAAENEEYMNVVLADTRDFWRTADVSPEDALHHWNHNAESFLRIGNEIGLKMIALCEALASFEEDMVTEDFSIYTDQVNKLLFLNFEDDFTPTFFDVYDLSGKNCMNNSVIESSIDISHFKPGIYFIRINQVVKKFVISY